MALLIAHLIAPPGGAVTAGELPRAQALYRAGEMREAATLAREQNSADAYVLAARATIVEALYQASGGGRKRLLERAMQDAATALELDPDSVDARIQRALALGHLAEDDPIDAQMNGQVEEGRKLIEQALELAPADPWAHGLLGMWHLQVVRHAGPALARRFYGASLQTGLARCEEALDLARGEDLALRFGCALSRLQVDPQRFGWSALKDLRQVGRMPARDAAERKVQAEAEELARELGDRLRE